MAGRRVVSPRALTQAQVPDVDDEKTSRALLALADAIARLERRPSYQAVSVDLEIGINTVRHSLGRRPVVCLVTPTVADASFAYGVEMDERQVLVTVLGADQPGASVFLL